MKQNNTQIFTNILFIFLILAHLAGCSSWYDANEYKNGSIHNLVESFDKSWVSSDRERYVFHDPVKKNTMLTTGWEFDEDASFSRFPWPRFTDSPGIVEIEWAHRVERRIFIKLLNIKESYHKGLLSATLNGHDLPLIENDQPVGKYEFYIPSGFQNIGVNQLKLMLDTEQLPSVVQPNYISLHSLKVTLGAIVRSRIQIGDQSRNSLLFAPPAKLQIPVESGSPNNLHFSYGLYSPSEIDDGFSYSLNIYLYENMISRPIFEKSVIIQRDTATRTSWQTFRASLPTLNRDGILELSFHSHNEIAGGIDYLALSEVVLLPEAHSWNLEHSDSEPDVMVITLSSVSAGQLGVYGNSNARTPFLDRLSRNAFLHTDVTSVSNSEIASVISMKSGKYPRDHGFYRDISLTGELPSTVTELLADTRYQSHAFVFTRKPAQTIFAKIPGFRRIYLSNPDDHRIETVKKQLNSILNTPNVISNPAYSWFHLSPGILSSKHFSSIFNLDIYAADPFRVGDLNLPLSEQERIHRNLSYLNIEDDVRLLLAQNDYRLMTLDQSVKQLFMQMISKRHKRSIAYVITSDHGVIRSLKSNLLSNDSLSQEVLHIPLIHGSFQQQEKNNITSQMLLSTPAPSLVVNNVLSHLIQNGIRDISSTAHISTSSQEPFFAEHDSRPVIASRFGNDKLIHVLSNPYFQIATTNLFDLEHDPAESINLVGRDSGVTRKYLDVVTAFCQDSPFYPRPRIGFEDEALTLLKSLQYTDQ